MRRLKQLLGTILLAAMTSTASATSASLLSGVRVDARDNAGVVTIQASGNFTHTEYRPTDSLILVDLAGVSLAHPDTQLHSVSVPGVLSWRVVGYRYASGAEVARVELNLAPGAQVKVADVEHGVELRVVGPSGTGAAQSANAQPAEPKKLLPSGHVFASARAAKTSDPSHIRNVSIVRSKEGLDVEITANGPIAATTMKLSSPDRVVVDIPNSILDGSKREIAVNGGSVKDVRVARYQNAPPSTRVVLDLLSAKDFEVVPGTNKLVVKLREPVVANPKAPVVANPKAPVNAQREDKAQLALQQPAVVPAAPEKVSVQPLLDKTAEAKSAEPKSVEAKTAPAYVITEPRITAGQAGKTTELPKSSEQVRAEIAAAHFTAAEPSTVSPGANTPPFLASASLAASPAMVNAALQQQAQLTAAPTSQISGCNTGRYTGDPFSINAKDVDLKDFFRLIHEISGLNIVLDQAVHGSLTIVLDDVPWDQALAIVLSNNGLDCVLQGNVLRIATIDTLRAEAESRHAQQDAQALAVPKQTVTRYLSYGHSKDVMPIIKKFLSPRGDVVSDDRSNALIIEDIPSVIPKIDALLPLLDRKTPEVEIEARVVSASRSFARDIGTQLGVGWGDSHTSIGGLNGNPSPIIDTNSNPGLIFDQNTKGAIPLFSNLPAAGGNAGLSLLHNNGLFRLDFILSLAENRGLAKILSRPRIITFNNVKAVIKQGQKIPIVTPAQLGGPPTVTYLDVVLRLTVTPQITAEHTIFLDIDVESTSINGKFSPGVNPSLNTAQATTQVLVSDGGTVVVGGVIVTQNTISVDQVPLLGDIPVLGNLFKHRAVTTSTNELIFFITPRILET